MRTRLILGVEIFTHTSCADPLAEEFDPTTPAPPELSSWLYLFHSYLQLEEVYLETMEWFNCEGAAPTAQSVMKELS